MKSSRWRPALGALAILAGIATSGCGATWVIVPHPATQYSATDTVYGIRDGERVRVTFHYDTIMRVDTVVRVDTAWVNGTRTIVRRDTVLRVDTVLVASEPAIRVDTVRVVSKPVVRVDTVRVVSKPIMRVDTLRVVVTDTVIRNVPVPGRRLLFLPPGHYPPEGECRVWIHGMPPGQQARPAPCDALGTLPSGAFVLFGGEAWDVDYDWVAEANSSPGSVPPQIVALARRKPGGPAIGSGPRLP